MRRQPSGPRRRNSQPYWRAIWRARTSAIAERGRGKSATQKSTSEARQREQRLLEQREMAEAHDGGQRQHVERHVPVRPPGLGDGLAGEIGRRRRP